MDNPDIGKMQVTLNVRVELSQRLALEEYAKQHGISLAEAVRRAIDALRQPTDRPAEQPEGD